MNETADPLPGEVSYLAHNVAHWRVRFTGIDPSANVHMYIVEFYTADDKLIKYPFEAQPVMRVNIDVERLAVFALTCPTAFVFRQVCPHVPESHLCKGKCDHVKRSMNVFF